MNGDRSYKYWHTLPKHCIYLFLFLKRSWLLQNKPIVHLQAQEHIYMVKEISLLFLLDMVNPKVIQVVLSNGLLNQSGLMYYNFTQFCTSSLQVFLLHAQLSKQSLLLCRRDAQGHRFLLNEGRKEDMDNQKRNIFVIILVQQLQPSCF